MPVEARGCRGGGRGGERLDNEGCSHRCCTGRCARRRRRSGRGRCGERGRGGRHGRDGRYGRCRDNRRRWRRQQVNGAHVHHGGSVAQHVEFGGGRVREVDDSIADEGTAIVDSNHDAAAVLQIRDAHVGGQRQRLVGGRHAVHIIGFAGRGFFLVEARAVPRCDSALPVADAGGEDVVAFAEDIVKRRIAVARARLHVWDGVRYGRRGRHGQNRRCGGTGGRLRAPGRTHGRG